MLIDFIKRHEGLRLKAYDDASSAELAPGVMLTGHPTIGWGRALDTNGISKEEAEILLARDITRASNTARVLVPSFGDLNSARQAALVSMAFQLGHGGLRQFKSMIAAIEAEDWPRARMEALHSAWATQTPARAEEIGEMLLTGRWPGE